MNIFYAIMFNLCAGFYGENYNPLYSYVSSIEATIINSGIESFYSPERRPCMLTNELVYDHVIGINP